MSLVGNLIGFSLRQVIGTMAGDEAGELTGKTAANVIQRVEQHFTDHSQTLPKALTRANDRAWQALSIALAGDGFLDQIKVFFASGDDKGVREQVRLFLQDKTIAFEGTSADFRKKCLIELKTAQQVGLLTAHNISSNDVARQTAQFQRYADPKKMADGAEHVMGQIADELAAEFPNLGTLVRQRPAGGPPLVVLAFAYFFRREVETNDELAHGLFFDALRQLSAAQDKSFAEISKALTSLGDQFDLVFEQLDRIETVVVETHGVAVETHGAVLDIQLEMQRISSMNLANGEVIRRLEQEVLNQVSQAGMYKGEVKPHHTFSIRSEDERTAVKQLLARFRQMPSEQQKQCPALLNGLGKLQIGSGDFDGARQTFETVSQNVTDATAQAEAQFNAYRAALEEKKWDVALVAIQKAASLDSQRFAPFPMQRYQPKQLLGAGGFGAAFLCHDRNFEEEVVVKTLHDAAMERNMTDVFREARLLRKLNHSAIIGVHECEFADPLRHARPYIVMDYFPGGSLEKFIHERGMISPEDMIVVARQVADGMQAAHRQNILHRDLKPENILVRKEGSKWKVKIIDFGLAFRKQTIETSMSARSTGNTILSDSVAGTIKYAPPEQMGEMKGVRPGPYSDVYSFGKMCCYALFRTTEPKNRHWTGIPKELHEMLEGCTEQELQHRLPSFEAVLQVLDVLSSNQVERKRQEEVRQQAERETKHRDQKAPPSGFERKPGEIITNSLGMKFAWIPPGTFLMGPEGSVVRHKVTLTKGFYMGIYPVTQEQWQAVMGNNPSEHEGKKIRPVESVSWDDCQEFIKKLRGLDKKPYRLPTEAEWEYACRAETTTPYYFGETISPSQANCDFRHGFKENQQYVRTKLYRSETSPVGIFRPNAWGLYDMHGNVWEWCQDWDGDYPENDVVDPQGPNTGKDRVLRGGGWATAFDCCDSAWRNSAEPGHRKNDDFGFRLCFMEEDEADRKRHEQEEAVRQRQELERLQREGEIRLVQLVGEALDRTQGKPTKEDSAAANEICKQHRIEMERAKQIVQEVREQWQKAHPPKPERKPGEIITNSLGMKFAWIPPGAFLMGSPKEETQRQDNEAQHRVTLSRGFYLGVHLVTQEQWQAVMGNNPSYFKGEKNLPVDQVSWEDCQEFVKKLRDEDKKAYRLPTEAEWEYACRAGTKTPFWFGDTISTDQANYYGNHIYGNGKKGVDRQKTTPVGSFSANAWGLYDTHGNLWEWCQDWLGDYPQNDVVDPQGSVNGEHRVLRGGSWDLIPEHCRSAYRYGNGPGNRSYRIGFRLSFCLD
jgi:formylglycine-generating enzyme required for sulfatase activity/tRNA A-37 threonylcarbamoyl transferase component Bud32